MPATRPATTRGIRTNHGLELRREHRPRVEERRRLTEIQEQDRLADLHLAQLEKRQQEARQLQEEGLNASTKEQT